MRPKAIPATTPATTPMTKPSAASSRVTWICSPRLPWDVPLVVHVTIWSQTALGWLKKNGSITLVRRLVIALQLTVLAVWLGGWEIAARTKVIDPFFFSPVSYTHLTLPTNREV